MNLLEILFVLYVITGVILCAKYFNAEGSQNLSNGEKLFLMLFLPSFMLFFYYSLMINFIKSVKHWTKENTLHETADALKSWLIKRN